MLDAVWDEMLGGPPAAQALAPLLTALRSAEVPFRGAAAGEAAGGSSGGKGGPRKRAKAQLQQQQQQ